MGLQATTSIGCMTVRRVIQKIAWLGAFRTKHKAYTNSMYPRAPKKAAEELSWRDRLASLRHVRPLLRLVWETSPPLVVSSIVLRLFRALLPLATLSGSRN